MLALSLVGDIRVHFFRAAELLPDVGQASPAGIFQLPCGSCSERPLLIAATPPSPPRGASGLSPTHRCVGWGGVVHGCWASFLSLSKPCRGGLLPSSELGHIVFSFGASAMTPWTPGKFPSNIVSYFIVSWSQMLKEWLSVWVLESDVG